MHYTNAKWEKSQRLTLELTGAARQGGLARLAKMYRVPRTADRAKLTCRDASGWTTG